MGSKVPVDQEAPAGGDLSRLVAELRQWHVFRIAAGYGVAAWLVVQVVATIGPAFGWPEWVLRAVVLASIIGFLATMGFLLFRRRSVGAGRLPISLSQRARVAAAGGVLLATAVAAALSVRHLSAREQVSLAVLPFADLSPGSDKAYFGEGVAEEILSTLAAEKNMKVLGRTSARQIERDPDPKAIRASLGVTHLLEGSTRTAGNDLRINVRLIDTSDGSQVWEEEYRGGVSDVFKVQDQIATGVVRRLRGTFFAETARPAAPASIDAYESYLAARAIIRHNKRDAIERAWAMAKQIVEGHPRYAPGHALYAETTMLLSDSAFGYGSIPDAKARRLALAHAQQAIRLTPDRAEGYAAIGLVVPVQDSIAPYRKALSLDPSRSDVRLRLAIALDVLKRPVEAFDHYRQAAEMEPLAPAIINRYIQILACSGRSAEALQVIDQFVQRSGLQAQGWRFRGAVYAYQGDLSRAVAARRKALQLDAGLPYQREWLAQYFHLLRLDDHAAAQTAGIPPYIAAFVVDDRGSLKARILKDGPAAWDANGAAFAVFSLARARDWAAIARFYAQRPAGQQDVCILSPSSVPVFARALHQQGRRGEAVRLMDCASREIARLLSLAFRSPDDPPGGLEVAQAALFASRNDKRAFAWLDKAIHRGWLGQYYSSNLADWPQFDSLRGDPRYAVLQRRIDASIARERAELLAGR